MSVPLTPVREWLETDGLGGFASGPVNGPRTRRYHALLLCSSRGPSGRQVLVNGLDATLATPHRSFALSTQHYAPDVLHPDGHARLESFTSDPWPRWHYALEDGSVVAHELFVPHGLAAVVLTWRLVKPAAGSGSSLPAGAAPRLVIRPFLSGRDYHALHRENAGARLDAASTSATTSAPAEVRWQPYAGVPAVCALHDGRYDHAPDWYRNFSYSDEQARGLDHLEDLIAPGTFTFDLSTGEATLLLVHADAVPPLLAEGLPATALADAFRQRERHRRATFPTSLHRAADAYLVRRGPGHTIVAGYPWFTDWGRDTFIALRGLCLATGRLAEARQILVTWAGVVSEGMLPNRFPDHGEAPEFNSVDASLWFVVAVHDFLEAAARRAFLLTEGERAVLVHAVEAIVAGYGAGTRHGIRADADGLLACGAPGLQLTWMDAKIGDWVVTPRTGKPVEVQALWINALWIATRLGADRWQGLLVQAREAFRRRFVRTDGPGLFDVVDCDHIPGRNDATLRANQIFAIGGLPLPLLDATTARAVVDLVETHLLTPLGLRSLAPFEPGYRAHYEGGVWERDSAYHTGTVWPFLLGAFVEAWVRVRGDTVAARREARQRFLPPLLLHLDEAGLGHVSEIADAAPPHAPRGCPWQAWSLGELLRLLHSVLADPAPATSPRVTRTARPSVRPSLVTS